MRKLKNLLVTGGAGFIGSNFIHYLFKNDNFKGRVVNVDKLTYAGNPYNLTEIDQKYGGEKYIFEKADITDQKKMSEVFNKYEIDSVVHFAAESHVDRSIYGPGDFINTNIIGTFSLLEASRDVMKKNKEIHFHHVSTDEVYGSLKEDGYFFENSPYDPRSPYSASKASSDHLVRSYHFTYGLPMTISNCSNNYGPYQLPEKLIPLMILNMKEEKKLPVYGDGKNIRDWIYVDDHNAALTAILKNGKSGETYNVGGEDEWENIKLVNVLCEKVASYFGKNKNYYKGLIDYVKDRPGHDYRYAINCDKIKNELHWHQSIDFEKGLELTIQWYLSNDKWLDQAKTDNYEDWIKSNYQNRGN